MIDVYKKKLQNKTIAQLKAICVRKYGKDLLRGNKSEMIHTLADMLDSPRRWGVISGRIKDEWDRITYENLNAEENEEIRIARRNGFAIFYPAYPSWKAQGINTLREARRFNEQTKWNSER